MSTLLHAQGFASDFPPLSLVSHLFLLSFQVRAPLLFSLVCLNHHYFQLLTPGQYPFKGPSHFLLEIIDANKSWKNPFEWLVKKFWVFWTCKIKSPNLIMCEFQSFQWKDMILEHNLLSLNSLNFSEQRRWWGQGSLIEIHVYSRAQPLALDSWANHLACFSSSVRWGA